MDEMIMSKVELADGSFVDHEAFVKGYDDLLRCYITLRAHLHHVTRYQKEMDALSTLLSKTEDGAKRAEAEEKLRTLREKYSIQREQMAQENDRYSALLDKYLPAPYHTDHSVRALCNIITHGKAGSIKEALAIYHEVLFKMEVDSIKKRDYELEKQLIAEREEIKAQILWEEKEAAQLYAQAAGYQAQAERSRRATEASITSAINSHLNRR